MNNGRRYLILIGVGLLSGISVAPFYFEIFENTKNPLLEIPIFPGIFYGMVTGIYFTYTSPNARKFTRLLAWTVASSASYFISSLVTMLSVLMLGSSVGFSVGGAVGAAILWFSFFIFTKQLIRKSFITTVMIGAAIPFLVNYFIPITDSSDDISVVAVTVLFVVWQTAITVLLGRNLFVQESPVLATQ